MKKIEITEPIKSFTQYIMQLYQDTELYSLYKYNSEVYKNGLHSDAEAMTKEQLFNFATSELYIENYFWEIIDKYAEEYYKTDNYIDLIGTAKNEIDYILDNFNIFETYYKQLKKFFNTLSDEDLNAVNTYYGISLNSKENTIKPPDIEFEHFLVVKLQVIYQILTYKGASKEIEVIDNLVKKATKDKFKNINNKPIRVEEYLAPSDIISRNLTNIKINEERVFSRIYNKKEVKTIVNIYNENINNYLSRPLRDIDNQILNAIYSLLNAGNHIFTYKQIASVLKGGKECRDAITDTLINTIAESIAYMRTILVNINMDEENKYIYHKTDERFTRSINLLYAVVDGRFVGGNYTDSAIEILAEPILFTYAKKSNQINKLNLKLLQTPIQNNEQNINIRGYLIEQIEYMKKSKGKRNTRIDLDSIYTRFNINSDDRMKKKRTKETIIKILNYWSTEKLDDGKTYISGFNEIKANNSYKTTIAIEIEL